uniref:Uncharacterized protein n=1 Tax=Vespula pensylvanica TaxID=30213 RepID=A0A834N5I0_VESPE|nr:hypothetical protein H0235_016574 [Vespula pensylvanica]
MGNTGTTGELGWGDMGGVERVRYLNTLAKRRPRYRRVFDSQKGFERVDSCGVNPTGKGKVREFDPKGKGRMRSLTIDIECCLVLIEAEYYNGLTGC